MATTEQITSFISEQIAIPDHLQFPLVAATAAVPFGYLAFNTWRFNKNNEEQAFAPSNPDLVNATLVDVEPTTRSRWQRWGASALGATGMSLLTVQAAHPSFDVEVENPKAKTVIITDHSFSMRLTQDITAVDGTVLTRRSALDNALSELPGQNSISGELGIVNFAETPSIISPLTNNWEPVLRDFAASCEIPTNQVSPNGSDLVSAVDLAADMFPSDQTESKAMVIVTDGIILRPGDAEEISQSLEERGITAEMILVGTPDGTYKVSEASSSTGSGVSTDIAKIIDEDPTVVASQAELEDALRAHTEDLSRDTLQKKWYLPGILGGVLTGWSFARFNKQLRRRSN
jgi:Mg-chelatase subunit ChlD